MNLFNDIAFLSFRETFDAVMKKRVLEGMFVIKHTENLTNKDENELWEKGVINKTTLKGLSMVFFFKNSKVFGLHGFSEHKDLKAEQLTVLNCQIVFQEFVFKTIKGGQKARIIVGLRSRRS